MDAIGQLEGSLLLSDEVVETETKQEPNKYHPKSTKFTEIQTKSTNTQQILLLSYN